jgi:predicted deacylase
VNRKFALLTLIAGATVIAGCAGSTSSSVTTSIGPRTRAERTGYLETSRYADVIAFLDSLKGRPELTFGSIGKTNEGRDMPYVIASRPRVSTPEEARSLGRPIVYVQGNIHAGEVEGKEALLALLRDLTNARRPNALDSVVLIAVPIYNADGNEKFDHQEKNRGAQNGPEMVGVRANAQNLDLNRDYIKAEAPETRASLAMFNAWDPHVFVDLHTTDGSYHGYALTYAPPLNPAAPFAVSTRDVMMPALRQRMQSRHGFPTFDYGDFIDDDTLSKGWVTFDSRPRFGTNYYGLRNRISILSEAYSHDPFERRVKATYAFVQEILSLVAERRAQVMQVPSRATQIPIRSQMTPAPESVGVVAEIVERTGDSTRTQPGVPKGRRRSGRFVTVKMPVFERFKPTLLAPVPARYVIAEQDTQVVRVLRLHGIVVTQAGRNPPGMELMGDGYVFMIDSTVTAPRPFQGHREMRLVGKWRKENRPVAPGSFMVDTSQPLGLLAVYMLEPQSDDGLADWNYFDSELKPGGLYPVYRLGGAPPTP